MGPYVSVRPYTCTGIRFSFVICSKRCAVGGLAATVTRTGRGRRSASAELHSSVLTVGAALKCVMPSSLRSRQISG